MTLNEEMWAIDKKIPTFVLLLAIIGNAALGIWWTAKLDSRVTMLENSQPTIQLQIAKLDLAREEVVLHGQKLEDKQDESNRYLQILMNRSNVLHPELVPADSVDGKKR